jgi:predicted Zn-dependent protease
MSRTVIAIGLLVITTILSVVSFRLVHRDFFYLKDHYLTVTRADRAHVLRIASRVDVQDTRNAAISMMLGEALFKVGEVESGLNVVKAQVELHPDDPGILGAYADMLSRSGRRAEADAEYRALLKRIDRLRGQVAVEGPI